MRQLTRSETDVRPTAPTRRPARVPRTVPPARRGRPAGKAKPVGKVKPARPAAGPLPAARPAAGAGARAARRGRPPRAPFVLLVVGLLCGGLVSLLLLNTVLAQDSFRASELRTANNQLRQKKEGLKHENMQREMPGAIARAANGQRQEPDWDEMNVITPDRDGAGRSAGTRAVTGARPASEGRVPDGRAPSGQERAAGAVR
ncbi:hypothetical protein GCM10017673_01240 [Streptosporangium violaceochromogenes]|nr:hypothetical protein GCM10017673_01240 [Streptosporangium violaceochromogenes]